MIIEIVIGVIGTAAGIAAGAFIGSAYRKKIAEAEIGSAETEAKRIVDEAVKAAETRKKEALLEAKDEIYRNKSEADRDIKERYGEVSRMERRVIQKEEALDKKLENAEKKDEALAEKSRKIDNREQEIERLISEQRVILEKVSGMTTEDARAQLLSEVQKAAQHDIARKLVEAEQQFKEEADSKARNILSTVIQRYAADYVSEVTVSVVSLPNDEMKGRIIGREGRNIRTIETLTGVDLIIDDTPEAITISSFDPIRREIARMTLEKLILDGRIHPTRIEESYEKSKKEVEAIIKAEGERAVFETGLHGVNPELVKLLGRLKYRVSYSQNVLDHSLEVAHIAGMLAAELGAHIGLAKRAGLLHDIGKAMTHEVEGSHVNIGVDIVKKYKENKDVINAVEAHHGDVEPQSIIAVLVQAADAISGARPGARVENLQNYIKRLEKLEAIANSFEGIEKSYAIQAGREIRIILNPEVVSDDRMVFLANDIVKKIEAELEYPGQIKIHLVRESRVIDYAK